MKMKESYKKILKLMGEALKVYIKNYTPIRILRRVLNFALYIIKYILIMVVVVYGMQYLVHLIKIKHIIPVEGAKRLVEMPVEDAHAFHLSIVKKINNWATPRRLANIFFPAAILYTRGKSIFAFLSYCFKKRTLNAYLILIAYVVLILLYINAITNNYVDRSSLHVGIYGILMAGISGLPKLLNQEWFRDLTERREELK
jgi:hypothetical protein